MGRMGDRGVEVMGRMVARGVEVMGRMVARGVEVTGRMVGRTGGVARRRLPCGHAAAVLAGLVLAGLLVVATAGPAAAGGSSPHLALRARAVPGGRPAVELVARLGEPGEPGVPGAPAGGKASRAGGVTVTFSVHLPEFAGAPLLVLGSATTDRAGEARLTYRPTFTGRQALVATATGTTGATIAAATTSYSAPAAVHPLAGTAEAVRPDGTIGQVVVGVLLGVVVLLWIVLVSVVVRVHRHVGASPP
jgi:hypothetical protein